MKSIVLLLVLVLAVCGCTAGYKDTSEDYKLPPELKDYKVVLLSSSSGSTMFVLVKKTNEDREVIGTSSHQGKVTIHTVVIDGKKYSAEATE